MLHLKADIQYELATIIAHCDNNDDNYKQTLQHEIMTYGNKHTRSLKRWPAFEQIFLLQNFSVTIKSVNLKPSKLSKLNGKILFPNR